MKLGFVIPFIGPAVSSATGLSAFCRGLEDVGYDTLWVGDRLVTPVDMQATYAGKEQPYPPQMKRYLDPVLLWTVAAAATSRVRLNASTLSTFYYEPVHLARHAHHTRRAQRWPPRRRRGSRMDEGRTRHRPRRGLAPPRADARRPTGIPAPVVDHHTGVLGQRVLHPAASPCRSAPGPGRRPAHLDRRNERGRDAPGRPQRHRLARGRGTAGLPTTCGRLPAARRRTPAAIPTH